MLTIAGMLLSLARREIGSMISTEALGSSEEVGSSTSRRPGSGITTPRGGNWYAKSVANVLARA
jgi:hypothetical protein